MNYNRPWKPFPEQLELLKSRGMVVTDEAAALDYLQRVGYYRLSAYWYPFRKFEVVQDNNTGKLATKALDGFQPGTQFVDAVHLYLFDKKLRLHLADALERIEISLRVDLSYLLGKRSPFRPHREHQGSLPPWLCQSTIPQRKPTICVRCLVKQISWSGQTLKGRFCSALPCQSW